MVMSKITQEKSKSSYQDFTAVRSASARIIPCLSRVCREQPDPRLWCLDGLLERGWPVHLRVVPPSVRTRSF
jgi:hypothetical protein